MSKEIIVNAGSEERRVAVLKNGVLDEFYVERSASQRLVGSIYKGKVESIMPGIGAAFVDIGLEKNGFLYVGDIAEEGTFSEIVEEEMGMVYHKRHGDKSREKKIAEILKKGQEIPVQVVKEPIGTKGARLAAHITLPGRYIVFMAHEKRRGISKKIVDQKERKRLKVIIDEMGIPPDCGVIVRTEAVNRPAKELTREASYLLNLYRRLDGICAKKSAPCLIYEEYGLVQRIARDALTEDTKLMAIDSRDEYKKTLVLLKMISPAMRSRLKFYKGSLPIFEKFNIHSEIEKIYNRKIELKSKGYIVIEQTEALVSIDVNSGRFAGRSPEDTVFVTNKEAAVEIARQIKLRDMGGIIVIDFIDMDVKEHRDSVFKILVEALRNDKAKTKVLNFSHIGLVEMTRQRMRRSLESASYEKCPYCDGKGIVKSPITMSIEVLRQLERKLRGYRFKRVEVSVNPAIRDFLMANYDKNIIILGKRTRNNITLLSDSRIHIEDMTINVK